MKKDDTKGPRKVIKLRISSLRVSGHPKSYRPEIANQLIIKQLVLRPLSVAEAAGGSSGRGVHPRTRTRARASVRGRRAQVWRRRDCFGVVSTLACRGRGPPHSGGRARAGRPEGGEAARRRQTLMQMKPERQSADDRHCCRQSRRGSPPGGQKSFSRVLRGAEGKSSWTCEMRRERDCAGVRATDRPDPPPSRARTQNGWSPPPPS